MTLRVLLIDDDVRLASLLGEYLAKHEVSLTHAAGGAEGLARAREAFDLVLLDVMMPGMDGLEVLRRLRARSAIPVIMLTARGDETDRVVGLELGADDYIPKPFSAREVLARMRAVLRRARPAMSEERVSVDGLVADVGVREVTLDGAPVELTGLQFDLLLALMRRAGRVVPRTALLEAAGRDEVVGERTVDVHISHIRKALAAHDPRDRISTVRGVGYALKAPS